MALKDILDGNVPEVPFKVTVDDHSIMKLSVAAVVVFVICLLFAALINASKQKK